MNSVSVPRIHLMFRKYTMNSSFISQIHFYSLSNREFTINFTNLQWKNFVFREHTKKSLSFSRFHSVNSLSLSKFVKLCHYLIRDNTTGYIANLLRIHFVVFVLKIIHLYKANVLLAPHPCGENCFCVIRDFSDCIDFS